MDTKKIILYVAIALIIGFVIYKVIKARKEKEEKATVKPEELTK